MRTPIRLRTLPTARPMTPTATQSPFNVLALMDELRRMYAKFVSGLEEIVKARSAFEAVKRGNPGLPGTNGIGKDGKNVTQEQVDAAVRKFLRQPKDGQAPTLEEVSRAVLTSEKFTSLIQKRIQKLFKPPEGPAEERVDVSAIVETVLAEVAKKKLGIADIDGLENRIRSTENRAAVYGSAPYNPPPGSKRGGGDTVVAGAGVSITDTPNGNKQISVSGGTSFLAAAGTVNGINQNFTFASAPTLIVVDQGRQMQKVSSDGTVNWTGTTSVVLTVAPNFDIYGLG